MTRGPGGAEAGRLAVRVLPDTSLFARSLLRYLERIEARTVLRIRTEVDQAAFLTDVRRLVAAAEHAATVQLDTDVDTAAVVAQARRVAAVASRSAKVRLGVDLDTTALRAALGLITGAASSAAKFALLPAALAGAVTFALALGHALAPAAGILAAIPALAVVAGAAVTVLQLAFGGLAEAIGGDADALAKLAPAAKAVVGELVALRPAWDAVRRTVQQQVFAPVVGEVRALAGVWLPLLNDRLSGIGAGFGALFASLARGARTPAFLAGIDAALAATQLSVADLADGAGPLLEALGRIVGAFAPALAGAGAGLARLATDFAAFIAAAEQSGQLAAFVQTVLSTLAQVGGIVVQLGGIIHAVFSAASTAGGGLLGNLEQLLTTVNTFLSAGEGKTALQAFFASAASVLRSLLPIVTTLAAGIGSVLAPAIADITAALGPALTVVAGALVDGVRALAPALGPLARSLGAILVAVAPLLPVVGQLAGVLAGLFAGALRNLATLLTPVVRALAGALAPALPQLAAAFDQWMTAMAPVAQQLGGQLAQALAGILPPLLQLIPTLITGVLPAMLALADAYLQVLAALLPVLPPLVELIAALAPIIALVAQLAAALITALVPVLVPVIRLVADLVGWIAGKLTAAIGWVTQVIGGPLVGALSTALGWFGRLLGGIVTTVTGGLRQLDQIPGRVIAVFNGARNWLAGAGRNIVAGLIDGLRAMLGAAVDAAWNLGASIIGAAQDALGIRSPSVVFAGIGAQTVAGFVAGIERAQPAANTAMAGLLTPPRAPALDPADVSGQNSGPPIYVLAQIGDRPVTEMVEAAVLARPERFAQAIRGGERSLARRG